MSDPSNRLRPFYLRSTWKATRIAMMDPEPKLFAPEAPRLIVPSGELEKAILTWLRVMPKRFSREEDPELYRHVATYLVEHFDAAHWEVVRRVPPGPASPPAYRG